jgi:hypothetical protein
VLLRLSGDSSGARKAIAETKAGLKEIDGTTAEADINVNGVEAVTVRIDELREKLAKVDHTTASAKVKLDTAVAQTELDKLEARLYRAVTIEDPGRRGNAIAGLLGPLSSGLDRVERRTKGVSGELRTTETVARSAFSGIGDAARTAGSVASTGLDAIGNGLVGLTRGVPVIGNVAAGIAGIAGGGLLAIPIIGLLSVAFVGLLSVLTALASVIAGAIAGAAALAVAFAAVAAPVAILAFGAVAKLAKTLLGSKDASDKAAASADGLAQAQRAQAQASSSLADAQQNASEQRVAALRDERDAVQAVADAEIARERASEGRVSSRLDLRQARLDLKDLRQKSGANGITTAPLFQKLTDVAVDPSTIPGALKGLKLSGGAGGKSEAQLQIDLERAILRVREAKTGVKSADQQAKTAATAYADALAKQNKYAREGITAYKPYADALKQTAKAQDALATATERTNKARRANVKAQANNTAATTGIGGTLKSFGSSLSDTIGPAIDAIFKGAGKGLAEIAKVLPSLKGSFTGLGQAIGDGLATLGHLFASPKFVSSFRRFTDTAADLVRHFATPAVADFAKLLLSIANAALPHLRSGLTRLGEKFHVFTDGATKGDKVRGVVDTLYDSFKSVVRFAGAVGRAIAAIFGAGQKPGQKLLDKITDIIDKFTNGLGKPKGRAALKKFFDDGVKFAHNMKDAVQGVIDAINAIVAATKKAVDLYNSVKGFAKNGAGVGGSAPQVSHPAAAEIALFRRAATDLPAKGPDRHTGLDALRGLIDRIRKILKDQGFSERMIAEVLRALPQVKGLAEGGVATSATHRIFGEAGPEAVIPLRRDVLSAIGNQIVASISVPMPPVGAWATSPAGVSASTTYGGHKITYAPQYHAQVDNQQHHETSAAIMFRELVRGL